MTSPPLSQPRPVWLRFLLAAAVLLTALGAIKSNVADPDLWGHVEFGREVLRSGELPQRTTWSFTSHGQWVNHENLAEIALAWVYDHGGVAGLIGLKLVLTSAIFGLMIWRARRHGVGWFAIGCVLLLAGRTMQFHWHYRPHVFGFVFFASLVALLDWVFEDWSGAWRPWRAALRGVPQPRPEAAVARMRWLWIGPPLLMLWTNTHGGYAAGTAIWIAYLALRIAEAWAWWGTTAIPLIKRLGMMIAAGGLAICFNPYGPQLHLWLAEDVWLPRPEISDWHPLWSLGSEAWPFLILLGVSVAAWCGTRLRRDLVQFVILSLVLWQSVSHVRHVLFFAILCGFWIPGHLDSALRRMRTFLAGGESLPAPVPEPDRPWLVAAVPLLWCGFVLSQLIPTWSTLAVDTNRYPVAAMQFLRDHKLYGRTVVAFNWSQYAIACFAADPEARNAARVAVDGRLRTCYSQETIDIYLDLFLGPAPPEGRYRSPRSPACDPARALAYRDPEVLVLNRRNPICQEALREAGADWRLVYEDSVAQIWGRRTFLREREESGAHLDPHVAGCEGELASEVCWPALPIERPLKVADAAP